MRKVVLAAIAGLSMTSAAFPADMTLSPTLSESQVEIGSGWYIRGDIGDALDHDARRSAPSASRLRRPATPVNKHRSDVQRHRQHQRHLLWRRLRLPIHAVVPHGRHVRSFQPGEHELRRHGWSAPITRPASTRPMPQAHKFPLASSTTPTTPAMAWRRSRTPTTSRWSTPISTFPCGAVLRLTSAPAPASMSCRPPAHCTTTRPPTARPMPPT